MTRTTRLLPKLASYQPKPVVSGTPRLWNAKRRIQVSKGLLSPSLNNLKKDPLNEQWREKVSPDVIKFVDDFEKLKGEMLPEEKVQLLSSPSRYFSRPHNVPEQLRQQVYFPDFSVTLRRTPHLGPKYAQFVVPLWFSKLDLKAYLKNLYQVETLHIRSFVKQFPIDRKEARSPYAQGQRFRPLSEKRMTAELVKPFIWPTEDADIDFEAHETANFWRMTKGQYDESASNSDYFGMNVNEKHRRSISEQAKELLTGKAQWSPTWKALPADTRVLQGLADKIPSSSTRQIAKRR